MHKTIEFFNNNKMLGILLIIILCITTIMMYKRYEHGEHFCTVKPFVAKRLDDFMEIYKKGNMNLTYAIDDGAQINNYYMGCINSKNLIGRTNCNDVSIVLINENDINKFKSKLDIEISDEVRNCIGKKWINMNKADEMTHKMYNKYLEECKNINKINKIYDIKINKINDNYLLTSHNDNVVTINSSNIANQHNLLCGNINGVDLNDAMFELIPEEYKDTSGAVPTVINTNIKIKLKTTINIIKDEKYIEQFMYIGITNTTSLYNSDKYPELKGTKMIHLALYPENDPNIIYFNLMPV